jgi:hypothetical protein
VIGRPLAACGPGVRGASSAPGDAPRCLPYFPQAFSHLSLISAAVNLDRQLDQAAG